MLHAFANPQRIRCIQYIPLDIAHTIYAAIIWNILFDLNHVRLHSCLVRITKLGDVDIIYNAKYELRVLMSVPTESVAVLS